MNPTDRLWYFIQERHKISELKAWGKPKPWTKDKILQKYRFCNVYRERDKVTIWIAKHWRDNHQTEPDIWFAMCVARFVNWPETLEDLGFPVPWDPARFKTVMNLRRHTEQQLFTGAYIIPSAGPKINYICDRVLSPLWSRRYDLRPVEGDTLQNFYERLIHHNGFGSFMAGQVIADLKYVRPLDKAPDWYEWAVPGPGSRRGLNRVLGRPKNMKWGTAGWQNELHVLHAEIRARIAMRDMPMLHAQDLQNCLCEFDKYERTRLGEGKPRSRYPGQFADLL